MFAVAEMLETPLAQEDDDDDDDLLESTAFRLKTNHSLSSKADKSRVLSEWGLWST